MQPVSPTSAYHLRVSTASQFDYTDALFYDVYTHVSDMHLADVGVDVEWTEVDVFADTTPATWGKTREYFAMRHYRLPVGKMRTV